MQQPNMIDSSMDKLSNPVKKKVKAKRNSSICKMINIRNSSGMSNNQSSGYGGAGK